MYLKIEINFEHLNVLVDEFNPGEGVELGAVNTHRRPTESRFLKFLAYPTKYWYLPLAL